MHVRKHKVVFYATLTAAVEDGPRRQPQGIVEIQTVVQVGCLVRYILHWFWPMRHKRPPSPAARVTAGRLVANMVRAGK